MPETPARELSSINFESMLGGPLMAVVNAQAKAAMSSVRVDASLDATVKYPPKFSIATVNLKVAVSHQKNTSSGYKVDRTYSMAVHIRAVQDEMPAGMEKILGILEDSIRSQPEVKK